MTVEDDELALRAQHSQQRYQFATSLGRGLETVEAPRPLAFEYQDSVFNNWVGTDDLTRHISASRAHGSRILDADEWQSIEQSYPFWTHGQEIEQIRRLYAPWPSDLESDWRAEYSGAEASEREAPVIVIDARPTQLAGANGTKNHALAVLHALVDAIGDRYAVAFLTDTHFEELHADIATLETISWRAALLPRVFAYFRLCTMWVPEDATDLYLLRAPWIQRFSVFLDDISGMYRSHFTPNAQAFWNQQLGIEKLATCDHILALSKVSATEAEHIFGANARTGSALASAQSSERDIVITSCIGAWSPADPKLQSPRVDRHPKGFVVFGSQMPHKNVAVAAAASAVLNHSPRDDMEFSFPNIGSAHVREQLSSLAQQDNASGNSHLRFWDDLSDEQLVELVSDSIAVIIPSLHEGFSLPVVESLAQGTPVVLSRIPAHLEMLDEGPWFFEPTNVGDLVRALREATEHGADWVLLQQQSLSRNYDPGQLGRVIRALVNGLKPHALANAHANAHPSDHARRASQPALSDRLFRETEGLVRRDREFMQNKFALQANLQQDWGRAVEAFDQMGVTEHNRLVREFRSSRTWILGRIIGSPGILATWFVRRGLRRKTRGTRAETAGPNS